MRKLLLPLLVSWSSFSFAKGQVTLVGPVGVQIRPGWSTWSAKLAQPIQVNPLQVLFWNTGRCPRIPITNVSVKYVNDVYWYNATPKDGGYHIESRFLVEAVKLDFYLDTADEQCVITVNGFRDIAEPAKYDE